MQTGLPALIADVNATTLAADKKAQVATALALAQIALTAVVQAQPQPMASVAPAPQKSGFLSQLSVRRDDQRDVGKWILKEPLVYQSDVAG